MSVEPKYWGSWKGLILKAIAIEGKRTWSEIQKSTGLNPLSLNQAIKELRDSGILTGREKYWIEDYDLYSDYVNYGELLSGKNNNVQNISTEKLNPLKQRVIEIQDYLSNNPRGKNTIISCVLVWTLLSKINFPFSSEHFYLEGDKLDRLTQDIIEASKKSIFVVNPFIDKCSLSDKIRKAPRCSLLSSLLNSKGNALS